METRSILTTDRLTRRFGYVTAVNAVTFSVARGEAFGILGRNGAGKTTLIKMLTTLLPPTSGSAAIAGHDLTRERFMGIGQVLTMPLFFASDAIYPIAIMPNWLKGIVAINPLTYEVDGLRALMLKSGGSNLGLGMDALVLTGVLVVLVAVGARLYPHIIT